MSLPLFSGQTVALSQRPVNQDLTQDDVDLLPWNAFVASDPDFSFYRRFDTLSTRVILELQDNVARIERALEKVDEESSRKNEDRINNGTLRMDQNVNRRELLSKARGSLDEYYRFVELCSGIRSRPPPTERDVTSVRTWLSNDERAIAKEEMEYVEKRDLFVLITKLRSPLRRFLELWSPVRRCGWWKEERPELPFYIRQDVHFYSDQRLETTASVALIGIVFFTLVAPLWILASANSPVYKLKVITSFSSVVFGILTTATTSGLTESLAATATYSAVLMVLLQAQNPLSELDVQSTGATSKEA
ncbi:hypothetical protein BJX64DRAFT_288600 [Aspergillus heterothallicus]